MQQPPPPDRFTTYAPHETPPVRPRRPWGAAILGLVVGLVVAVAVGVVLVGTNVIKVGSVAPDVSGVSATPITLPSNLSNFQDLVEANRARAGASTSRASAIVSAQQANQAKVSAATVAAYQRANPGAAVGYRAYADADLLTTAAVIAVRAADPGLTIGPVSDPSYLGLAVAQQQVKIFGDVQCAVYQSEATVAGSPVNPALDLTTMCQRSGPQLTVQVYGSGFRGSGAQQQMVALTNAAWTSVQA